MSTLTPLFHRVLILPDREVSRSRIILTNVEKKWSGIVVAVGEQCESVKKGDKVLLKKFMPEVIEYEGNEYFICEEEDVLATL